MVGSVLSDASQVAAVVVGGFGLVLGLPAYLTARHARRVEDLAGLLKEVVVGPDPVPARSPEHPSMIDIMTELTQATRDLSSLSTTMAWHMSDGHGGRPPKQRRGSHAGR